MNDNNEEYVAGDSGSEEVNAVVEGPGRYLREAREAQQLTQQQVAAELRMQARTIDALENDDYQSLPGSTFVQGYLRSYARLLGMDESAIVAMGQRDSAADGAELRSVYETSEQMSSSDLPVRMVSYLVVLAAVVGLAWWLAQKLPSADEMVTEAQSGSNSTEHSLVMQVQPSLESEATERQENAAEGVEGQSSAEAISLPQSDSSSETLPQPVAAMQGGPTEQQLHQAEDGTASEAASVPATAEPNSSSLVMASAVNPDAPPALRDDMPQSRIELEYQADSWTEITDAAGRQLVYSLVAEGRSLVLRGEAPFKVFLGYAPGVNIYFNGDLYDHTPYQRGDVARFRIGRAEHNRPLSGN